MILSPTFCTYSLKSSNLNNFELVRIWLDQSASCEKKEAVQGLFSICVAFHIFLNGRTHLY